MHRGGAEAERLVDLAAVVARGEEHRAERGLRRAHRRREYVRLSCSCEPPSFPARARPGVPGRSPLCSLAMAAGSYATLGFAPLAPLIREDFSLTRWQVGAITAIVFGGAAISSAPSGRLTDRFGAPPHARGRRRGRRLRLPAGRAPRPARLFFLLGVGAVGLAYGLITPPTNVIVRGAPTTRHRSLLMSIKQVGVTIGGFIAGITMPTIAHDVRLAARAARPGCGLLRGGALGAAQPPHARAERRRCAASPARSGCSTAICPRRFALGVGRLRVRHGRPAARLRDLSQPLPQGGARLPAGGGRHLAGGDDGGRHGRPAALGGHLRPLLRRSARRRGCASTRCSAWPA